ncbi:unnamed protein product [Caenorhabditis bovis]|uniref:SXP/RAL-2 family protein Ani s 5-like cation-binding domain-containing protein n=1 Tax=Caenorhabditis bovis TaxID=2654633 RepID=A0A8S1EW05_9PELO|nr:unnamed protein product [Caenorhabditis bovis]
MLRFVLLVAIALSIAIEARHDHKNKHRGEQPEFLRNLTSSQKKSFFEITKNPGLSIQQKEDKLKEWAKEKDLEEEFEKFSTEQAERKQKISKNISEVISKLAEAKEKVDAIMADKSKTRIQQQEAIKDLTKEYLKEIPTLFYIGKLFEHDHRAKKDSKKKRN